MSETIIIPAKRDHVAQWSALLKLYMEKRGSDPDRNRKAIPRTTNGDVAELTRWWSKELERALLRHARALANDKSKSSRTEWLQAKDKIEKQVKGADAAALYPENEWFWHTTGRLAIYLESLKAVPTSSELLIESVRETVDEYADAAKNAAADAAERSLSWLKTGALIAAGLVGAAIALPPIIRALRE